MESNRLIIVHCDAEEDKQHHLEIARRGAWVEYDSINPQTAERTIKLIKLIVDNGFKDQLLLSQDAGWYNVGQPNGGKIRDYTYLVKDFIPLMLKNGFSQGLVNKILVKNSARAFSIP